MWVQWRHDELEGQLSLCLCPWRRPLERVD
jgi:hypothetical protein